MHRVWGIFAVFLLLPLSALAQNAARDEREQEMQEMRARIEKLEKLVAQLQKEKETNNGVATAPATGGAERLAGGRSGLWRLHYAFARADRQSQVPGTHHVGTYRLDEGNSGAPGGAYARSSPQLGDSRGGHQRRGLCAGCVPDAGSSAPAEAQLPVRVAAHKHR